jgi:nicotinamidase/pyrazinamidase
MNEKTIRFDRDRSVLLLVDIQADFMPGGALPVAGGDRIVEPLRLLMETGPFRVFAATQDWHPPGHVSFASSHAGKRPFETIELYGHRQTLWPDHCVQGSTGARLHEGIPWDKVAVMIRKGMDPDSDSYSGFRNNWNPCGERPPTGLAGYLRERDIDTVFCCGLARDVCVKWTALDAVQAGFRTCMLWDMTRAVDPQSDDAVRGTLSANGVEVIESDSLPRP